MTGIRSHPNPSLHDLARRKDIQRFSPYYNFWRALLRVSMPIVFKTRVFNRHYEPATGGVVYICNHQSFLDPMLMAFGLRRPVNFMARHTLFEIPGFKQLIESVDTFPVDRDSSGMGGLKEAMRRVKRGCQVAVFAEGTRTYDGKIQPFMPGVALLSQRGADWTVPVVIDGAFEAWPRTKKLFGFGNIIVQYDKAIPQSVARGMKPKDFVEMVRQRMIKLQTQMRERMGRAPLEYD